MRPLIIFKLTLVLLVMHVRSGICQARHSRDSSWSYFIGTKIQGGSILINNEKLKNLDIHHPFIAQIDLSLLKTEQKVWDYCSCYIRNGMSINYTDFGNAKSLGRGAGIALFTEPIILLSNKIQVTLRGGAGFAYNNKIYDKENNINNITVSKPVSYLLIFNPNIYFSLNERIQLSAGVQISHISNGGSRWPNWGLNYVTGNAGVSYMIHPQILKPKISLPFTDKSVKFLVLAFGGAHHFGPTVQYPETSRGVGGVNAGALKPLSRVNLLGVGSEMYYDGIGKVLEKQSGKNYHNFIGSLSIQHYFSLGKLLFGQQLAYVVTPTNPDMDTRIYQRYILAYKIKKNWVGGVSLRAHGKVSDYLTLTTGFIF
jgi:hypothetical protein